MAEKAKAKKRNGGDRNKIERPPAGRLRNKINADTREAIGSGMQQISEARKRGIETSYVPELDELAFRFAMLGCTNKEIQDSLCISEPTYRHWCDKHVTFETAIMEGRQLADSEVAGALFHRAVGYSHPEAHVSNYQGAVTITPLTKHYPPDTQAAIKWLSNRRGGIWKDAQRLEHTGANGGPIQSTPMDLSKFSSDDLRTIQGLLDKYSSEGPEGSEESGE